MRNNQDDGKLLIAQLQSRFLKKPRKCRKINDSFIDSAQRIVCLSDNTFNYYPKIQQFKDLDFDKLQYVVPKAGVKLNEILQLKFPERMTNQRNYFSIKIPKNKILKYAKNQKKPMIVDDDAQGEQIWIFYFDYDIVALPEKQKRLERYLYKQNEKQMKKEEQIQKQKEIMKKQKAEKLRIQFQSLREVQLMQLKEQNQFNQKKKQLQQRQTRQKTLEEADELSFNFIFRKIKQNNNLSQKQLVSLQLDLLQKVGNFSARAEKVIMKFIDEMTFNETIIKIGQIYRVDNLILKFGNKNINQQYLANYYIASTVYNLRNQFRYAEHLSIPLHALIKYKGFKVLVRAITPIDDYQKRQIQQLTVHGYTKDNWKVHFLLSDDLTLITNQLNLKPYNGEVHYQKVQIHIGISSRLIQTKNNPFESIKNLDPNLYSQQPNYKIIYILDADEIYPIDIDLEKQINQSNIRFRPEYVLNYTDLQTKKKIKLSGGGLFYQMDDEEGQKQDLGIAKASQQLKYVAIAQFVKYLDSLSVIPQSPSHFKKIFEQNGINIRYLGKILKLTSLPYLKEMCTIEAIARSIKKMYREHQIQFCSKIFREENFHKINQAFFANTPVSKKKISIKELKIAESETSIYNAIDFLNLVFGNSFEGSNFWKIIISQVKKIFDINVCNPEDLSHGYLLISVLYHCGFKIKIQNQIKLFTTHNPFTLRDWESFDVSIKTFDYPQMKAYQYTKIQPNFTTQMIMSRLQLKILIQRALRRKQAHLLVELSKYQKQIKPPTQKFTIESLYYYLYHPSAENFNTASNITQFILPSNHPMFIQLCLKYSDIKDFDPIMLKKTAKYFAIKNLGITHWKTSEILSNFNENQYIENLTKAEVGVNSQRRMKLYLDIALQLQKIGKLIDCTIYVTRAIKQYTTKKSDNKLNDQIQQDYFKILSIGMNANYNMRRIQDMLKISQYFWNALQSYTGPKQHKWYELLFKQCMKVYLQSNTKKYYIFKIAIVLNENYPKSFQGDRKKKIQQLIKYCKESKNHINWIKQLLTKLQFGYSQINYQTNFFTSFNRVVEDLQSQQFVEGLRQLSYFVDIFGIQYFEQALVNTIYVFQKGGFIE